MIVGVILAGGRSSRMRGVDKAGALLGGRTLLDRSIARLSPQVARLAVNANGPDLTGTARLILPDLLSGHQGPLAGIHAGLAWAATLPDAEYVATASVDTPFLPRDVVDRLSAALGGTDAPIAIARSGGRIHPTCALWSVSLLPRLESYLSETPDRKLTAFAARVGYRVADFEVGSIDPFFNVNTPDDLTVAQGMLEIVQ